MPKYSQLASATVALGALLVLKSPFAAAADATQPESHWGSAAHLGYAVEETGGTGFSKVGGSTFFLDALDELDTHWTMGLRTTGAGGQVGTTAFYRLSAGPMFAYAFTPQWQVQASVGFFAESARDNAKGLTGYLSHGTALTLGWEQLVPVMQGVDFAWGAFVSRHWGSLERQTTAAATNAFGSGRVNVGGDAGLEASIRMSL